MSANQTGPVAFSCRLRCSFKPPFARKRRDFSSPVLSVATVLRGDVSLDNNGGFVQIAFDVVHDGTGFDASGWDGIELETCGNGESYDIRLRTDQLTRPWQSFRSDFVAASEWRKHRIAFDAVIAHKTEARFDPAHLRRIGILAIGREFEAEVAIANIRLYRLI